MKTWRITRFGDEKGLSLSQSSVPKPGVNDVLIKVYANALNPADVKLLSGKDGARFIHATRFPINAGFDFSGEVISAGKNVDRFKTGDEVFGFLPYGPLTQKGAFSEFLIARHSQIAPKPGNITHAEAAAAATAGITALQALKYKGGLIGGQKILINGGTGGVGSYAIQIAIQARAKVWCTCSEKNMEFARQLGAQEVYNYQKTPIHAIDEKFDVILDAASTSSYASCKHLLKFAGRYITLLPSASQAMSKLSTYLSSKYSAWVIVKPRKADLNEISSLLAKQKIRSYIAASFSFSDLPEAYKTLKAGVAGKVVIVADE